MKLDRWSAYGLSGLAAAVVAGLAAQLLAQKKKKPAVPADAEENKYDRGLAELVSVVDEADLEAFNTALDSVEYFLFNCDDLALCRRFCEIEAKAITLEIDLSEAEKELRFLIFSGIKRDPQRARVLKDCTRYVGVLRKYQHRREGAENLGIRGV